MILQETKEKLRRHISKCRLGFVIDALLKIIKDGSSYTSQVILISANFVHNRKTYHIGSQTLANYNHAIQPIMQGLLDVVEELEEEDLINNYSLALGGISNPILVICFDQERKEAMTRFFSPLVLSNVQIEKVENYKTDWKNFDITIWNNTDLPSCPDEEKVEDLLEWQMDLLAERELFLKTCLTQNPSPHFIHLGEPYYFVQEHRDRVYAANSEYALFARIQEMLAYIKAHNIEPSNFLGG